MPIKAPNRDRQTASLFLAPLNSNVSGIKMKYLCIQLQPELNETASKEEALNALTINAAYAMELSETHGTISLGKKTPVIITEVIPNLAYIPYSFGDQLVHKLVC